MNKEKQSAMKQPHDNWGKYYDFVYERNFGSLYKNFTNKSLNAINQILPKGTILDFGAGTGRLSLPLAEQGYNVIAVEKSIGMVNELKRKLENQNFKIKINHCSISDYENGNSDLAIALFTVLSYSITEDELSKNIENICKHINSGGYFFFDLPHIGLFANEDYNDNNLRRHIEIISNKETDIYTYKEQCSGVFNGQEFNYEDEFKIRYWEISTLDNLLKKNGFNDTLQSFSQFNLMGATYKLYKKQ